MKNVTIDLLGDKVDTIARNRIPVEALHALRWEQTSGAGGCLRARQGRITSVALWRLLDGALRVVYHAGDIVFAVDSKDSGWTVELIPDWAHLPEAVVRFIRSLDLPWPGLQDYEPDEEKQRFDATQLTQSA